MNNTTKMLIIFLLLPSFTLALISCSTLVPVETTIPSQYDLSEYRNMAVIDIAYPEILPDLPQHSKIGFYLFELRALLVRESSEVSREQRFASSLQNDITRKLMENGYFTLYTAGDIPKIVSNDDIPEVAFDSYFIGKVIDVYLDRSPNEVWEKNRSGQRVRNIYFDRQLSIQFSYQIIDAQTAEIVVSESVPVFVEDRVEGYDAAGNYNELYSRAGSLIAEHVAASIMPLRITEYRSIWSVDDNQQMQEAEQFVKQGNYVRARDLYLSVWQESGIPEAAYNAGILFESLHEYEEAIRILSAAYEKYPEDKIYREITRLQNIK